MRYGAYVCFGLATLFLPIAIWNAFFEGAGPVAPEDRFGYIIGSFLIPVILLIVGDMLLRKARKKEEQDREG